MEGKGRRSVAGHPFKYGIILNFVDEQCLYTPSSLADLVVKDRKELPTLHRNIRRSFSRFIKAHMEGPPDGFLNFPGKKKDIEAWYPRRIRAHIDPEDLELPSNCFDLEDLLEVFSGQSQEDISEIKRSHKEIKESRFVKRSFPTSQLEPLNLNARHELGSQTDQIVVFKGSGEKTKEIGSDPKSPPPYRLDFQKDNKNARFKSGKEGKGSLIWSKLAKKRAIACGFILFISFGLVTYFSGSFFNFFSGETHEQEDWGRILDPKNRPELFPGNTGSIDYGEIFRSRKANRKSTSQIYVPLVVLIPGELEALKWKKPLSSSILQGDQDYVSVYFLNQRRIDLAPFD